MSRKTESMKRITLIELKAGHKGTIVAIDGGAQLEKRLAVMGIAVDKHVTKLSAFVMRGPVAVRVGRTVVALGHGVAGKIWVTVHKK